MKQTIVMEEIVEIKKDNKFKNLIGILLIMPTQVTLAASIVGIVGILHTLYILIPESILPLEILIKSLQTIVHMFINDTICMLNIPSTLLPSSSFLLNFLIRRLLVYVPIIIGIVLSYKKHSKKICKPIALSVFVLLVISICSRYLFQLDRGLYNWYQTSPYEELCWVILKVFLYIFYCKMFGWKKGTIFGIVNVLFYILLAP